MTSGVSAFYAFSNAFAAVESWASNRWRHLFGVVLVLEDGPFGSQMYWARVRYQTVSLRAPPYGFALQALPTPGLYRASADFGLTLR